MHALEIREKRFRLQQSAAKLEEGSPERADLEQQVAAIQEACPHEHPEQDPDKGWRCRNCDLTRPPEPVDEPAEATAEESTAEPATADA